MASGMLVASGVLLAAWQVIGRCGLSTCCPDKLKSNPWVDRWSTLLLPTAEGEYELLG